MAPTRRRRRNGLTRSTATKMPARRARISPPTASWRVVFSPSRRMGRLSRTTGMAFRVPCAEWSDPLSTRHSRAQHSLLGRLLGGAGGWLGRRDVLAEPLLVDLLPAALLLDLREHAVHELHELRVALGDPDAVGLLGELLTDDLDVRILLGEAGQDDVVGADGVGAPLLHGEQAVGVLVGLDDAGLGLELGDVLLARGALGRADPLAGRVLDALDRAVLGRQHLLARLIVDIREVDLVEPLLGDGHRG